MSTTAITLPPAVTSRGLIRQLTRAAGTDVAVNASDVAHLTMPAADELVKAFTAAGTERVIFVNASPLCERMLRTAHRARATPERSFLLMFRAVSAEALLRSA